MSDGEVCRKIELLRQQIKDLEKELDTTVREIRQHQNTDNRELWQNIDKLREDLQSCKINFTTFGSTTSVQISDVQRRYEDLSKDIKDIKSEISSSNRELLEMMNDIKNTSQKHAAKNSAVIAIIVSLVLFMLSKAFV